MGRHRMAFAFAVGVALWTGVLVAQTYPHAFPRIGARLVFENDRVAIWEVVWHHGGAQPHHQHLYDMAGVYLRYGLIKVTRPEGVPRNAPSPGADAPYEVPRQLFQRKGVTHKEEGVGKPNEPEQFAFQTDLKGYSPAYANPQSGTPPAFPRENAKKGIDSDRVVFWDYTWQPGTPTGMHFHDKDRVEVFVTGGTLRTTAADGHQDTQTIPSWSARFVPGNQTDNEEAVGGPVRAVVVELRQATP